MIDHQSQMSFATKSIDAVSLRNNAALVSKAAREFKVSTILTTVAEKSFSGPIFDEIRSVFPEHNIIDRTSMNTWEDERIAVEVNRFARNKIVLAGLWTSVCIVGPALSALDQGFEVYVIADACGDVSEEAHQRAMERMIQLGARPMTSLQYLLELQRDWARGETYNETVQTSICPRWCLRPWPDLRQDHVQRIRRPLTSDASQPGRQTGKTSGRERNGGWLNIR
ncbi:Isochorismatase family protein [compost metagenome]